MKIAYIFAYFGYGGAEENAIILAQKAKAVGDTVIFIVGDFAPEAQLRLQKEEFKIVNLPMKSSFGVSAVLRSAIDLKKIIQFENIDIVHSHMLREQSLAIIAKLVGAKFGLIRTFHRLDQFNWKMRPLMPIYRKFTDAFISISEMMSDYLRENRVTNRTFLIKNGIPKVEAKSHERALGFIGRLAKEKGVLEFIKANIDLLRKNKMVIAGDGPDSGAIRDLIKSEHLNIEFLGRVANSDKADFYKKISVYVLPSEAEVLPYVVLEAYSCGIPVVAFDIDSMKALISKENGVLVDYPDYVQLGQEAVKLLSDSSKFYEANIKKYESEYTADIMWAGTRKLYESVVKS